jgi:hypothetical protein
MSSKVEIRFLPRGILIEYPTFSEEEDTNPVFIPFTKINYIDVIGVYTAIHLDGGESFTFPHNKLNFEKLITHINR